MDAGKKWEQVPNDAYGYRAPEWQNQIANMPNDKISDYNSFNLYIIDDVERGPGVQGGGSAHMVQHASCCNAIHDLFNTIFTDCTVHNVRFQAGQRETDFKEYFAEELEQYTADDLVAIYFHGRAGNKGSKYTWRFYGPGPTRINASDFIRQVNSTRPDCYFILDCFVPTIFPDKWKRKYGMTEISATGHQINDDQGNPVNGPENFTESLCRAVRAVAIQPCKRRRPTLHHIMGRDGIMCSTPLRLWLARPDRFKRNDVWRFFVDMDRMERTGRFEMRRCRVTGPRQGDGEFDREPNDDEDGEIRDHRRKRRRRGGGGRHDEDDDSDSGLDSDGDSALGADEIANDRPHAERDVSDSESEQVDPPRPRCGSRPPSNRPGSPATGRPRKAVKRSDSPFFDVGGTWHRRDQNPVKREASVSPDVEFLRSNVKSETSIEPDLEVLGSRSIAPRVDLTIEDAVIELDRADEDDEPLFVPQD